MIKLQPELEMVCAEYRKQVVGIKAHSQWLKDNKEQAGYKDYEVRLVHDIISTIMGPAWICSMYDKYNCHDTHIGALSREALRRVCPEVLK